MKSPRTMPDRRSSRRMVADESEDEAPSRRSSRSSRRESRDGAGHTSSRRAAREKVSAEEDEDEDEDEPVRQRRSSRASTGRKPLKDSDGEAEAVKSESGSEDETPSGGRRSKRERKRQKDDDEWDEEMAEDDDDDEEDDWKRDAKDALANLKRNKVCRDWFCEPVDAEALRLDDYFQIITKPMDLGTVTTKLNDGKYESEEDFCEEVLLTFNNAIKYNPQDSEIHLIAVQLKKKFRDLWNKARPESGVNNLLDSRELNGRFWADDKDKEGETGRRSTRRSLGESTADDLGRGRGGRSRVKRDASGSDSEKSGYEERREYRLRDRPPRPAVPSNIGSGRSSSRNAGMHDYVQRASRFRDTSGGQVAKIGVDGKRKLMRPSTVVSEGGRRLRVFETDCSESGEDIPSKNAHLPYEPRGGRGSGGGNGGGGGGSGYGAGFDGGGNDVEGGGGGGKKEKGKDPEIVAINADISTMEIDESVNFTSIGGLDAHIRSLKESVFLPLTYPEVFEKLGIKAPGGVLFHGPPGTGKTMMARALANSCSQGERKISFFMRKGADCLSKYHGEAERQLRLLFEQAALKQPSIIFFDEIDGLAPVRSSRQDQIHSSIVSTLLALMDGLDKRGMVVCVGATNRPDAVDPALRRPGRFDREFYFPLPDAAARAKILEIYTLDWKPPLSQNLIDRVANACVGFGGADIKALCTEAGIRALRRTYPQIYMHDHRLKLDKDKLYVSEQDLLDAMGSVKCSSRRSAPSLGVSLPSSLQQPLQSELVRALEQLTTGFAMAGLALNRERKVLGMTSGQVGERKKMNSAVYAGEQDFNSLTSFRGMDIVHRPRLVLWGRQGDAQGHIARAVLQSLDPLPIFGIGMQSLYMSTGAGDAKTLEEALVAKVSEARNRAPSILYLPDYHTWMEVSSPSLRSCLESSISGLPAASPVVLLAFADISEERTIFDVIQRGNMKLFTHHHLLELPKPTLEQRKLFFDGLLQDAKMWRKPQALLEADLPELERDLEMPKWEGPAAPIDPAQQDRNTRNMRGIRMKMREKCLKLYNNRKFKDFQLPVLDQPLPDKMRAAYKECVAHPMDLATLLWEIDRQIVKCCSHFRERIQLIHDNAYRFNGPSGPEEAQQSPTKSSQQSMYIIPDQQEHVLEPGKIIEMYVKDTETLQEEWVPGKISEVKHAGEIISSFSVHVVVDRPDEQGSWVEPDVKPDEIGKDWRWPTQTSKDEQDLDEILNRQKTNAKICANASALVDESEENLGTIDSWLIEETDRLVKATGYVLAPPNRDAQGLGAAVSGINGSQLSRQASQSKSAAPSTTSTPHNSQRVQQPHTAGQSNRNVGMPRAPTATLPPPIGSNVRVMLTGRLFDPGVGMPLNSAVITVVSHVRNEDFQVAPVDLALPSGWTAVLSLTEENVLWQRCEVPMRLQQQQQMNQFQGGMGAMGVMPDAAAMLGSGMQNGSMPLNRSILPGMQQLQQQQMAMHMIQQGSVGGSVGATTAVHAMGGQMTGEQMMAGTAGAEEHASKKRRFDEVDRGVAEVDGRSVGNGENDQATSDGGQKQSKAEEPVDRAMIQDIAEADPTLAEELKIFVQQLVQEDGQDKNWDQLLELHSALYAVLAKHEHEPDRFKTMGDMRDSLHQWRRRCGAK